MICDLNKYLVSQLVSVIGNEDARLGMPAFNNKTDNLVPFDNLQHTMHPDMNARHPDMIARQKKNQVVYKLVSLYVRTSN